MCECLSVCAVPNVRGFSAGPRAAVSEPFHFHVTDSSQKVYFTATKHFHTLPSEGSSVSPCYNNRTVKPSNSTAMNIFMWMSQLVTLVTEVKSLVPLPATARFGNVLWRTMYHIVGSPCGQQVMTLVPYSRTRHPNEHCCSEVPGLARFSSAKSSF
jgi:hypothetical protein